jgi:hypothetical protein
VLWIVVVTIAAAPGATGLGVTEVDSTVKPG